MAKQCVTNLVTAYNLVTKRSHLVLQERCILLQPFAYFMQLFVFPTSGELLEMAHKNQTLYKFAFFIQLNNYIKFWFVPLAWLG